MTVKLHTIETIHSQVEDLRSRIVSRMRVDGGWIYIHERHATLSSGDGLVSDLAISSNICFVPDSYQHGVTTVGVK